MFADLTGGGIALAHNGNLTNARLLRTELVGEGRIFQSTSDTEVIIHLAARKHLQSPSWTSWSTRWKQVEGAYSLVSLTSKKLIGVRDPWGVRPLVLGKLEDAYILASETCALDIIGAEYVRDIEPGELIVITKDASNPIIPSPSSRTGSACSSSSISRGPISTVEGRNVYAARKRIGEELAREAPAPADMVIPGAGFPARRRRWASRPPRTFRSSSHHPQSLRWPHLHRADRRHPQFRRQEKAQSQPRGAGPASASC